MPTVSVIIPTYNRAHVLGRSIQSVLNQTFQDFELIIVDDGSTDDTETLVNRLRSKKIKYIRHQVNQGGSVAPTPNTGLRLAKGDYIAFQDDDDEWIPEKLERQMKVMCTAPPEVGVVYARCTKYDSLGNYIPPLKVAKKEGYLFKQLLNECYIQWTTALIKKECFNKVGLINESMLYARDWEFLLRVSQHYQFLYIDDPLVIIYELPESRRLKHERLIVDIQRILEMYFPQIKQDRKVLAKYYYHIARLSCMLGRIGQGRHYYLKSLKAYPMDIVIISAFLTSLLGSRIYNTAAAIYRRSKLNLLR
ncbi:MAG: glycosyltransferase [Desulfobacteraceae bacterium]|nr:glycosyltransferase [Desulfobacteraceae bacterium]